MKLRITLRHIAALVLVSGLTMHSYGQKTSIETFYENIENATSPTDTLLSIFTCNNASISAQVPAIIEAYEETLNEDRPLFGNLFIQLVLRADTTGFAVSTAELINSSYPEVYKDFARVQIELKRPKPGVADSNVATILQGDYTSRKGKALAAIYAINQSKASRDRTAIIDGIYSVIDALRPDLYPILQLGMLTSLSNYKQGHVDSTDIVMIEAALDRGPIEDHNILKAKLLIQLQLYYKNLSNTEKRMEASLRAIELAKAANDTTRIVTFTINHATTFHELGQFETAYEILEEARVYAIASQDSAKILGCDGAVALAKMNEKKYDEALEVLKHVVNQPQYFNQERISLYLINIIESHYAIEEYDSAYVYYQKLIENDPNDDIGIHSYAKNFATRHLINTGQWSTAMQYAEAGYADALATGDKNAESIALLAKSDLAKAKGNYKEALDYYADHMGLEQDFRNEDRAAEATRTQLNYKFDKEKALTALKTEQEKALLAERQKRTAILGGIAALGLAIMLLLYRSIKTKNTQIETQNIQLQELNTTKDTLFQIIGHDLKKPTIGFRNISKNIKYLLQKGDYQRLEALGEEVDQDAKSLYLLTDNLLNWATVQKDALSIRPEAVDLHPLISENISLFENVARRKGIQLINEVEDATVAHVDRNSIDTVIRNLIDNAIKYTDEGGRIVVSSITNQGMVKLQVRDTGRGVSPALLQALDDTTAIASTAGTAGESGSGIGLQLVKRLIAKNSGTFKLSNHSDKGAVATVALPVTA